MTCADVVPTKPEGFLDFPNQQALTGLDALFALASVIRTGVALVPRRLAITSIVVPSVRGGASESMQV